ncbi:MAG: DNA polymerase IV [Bacilli bacterium]|nr:DNA polymerase IV [Bacilli bacterium]
MAKVIMHVDLNYFFVRCEELKNPRLVNQPVMIGGVGRAGIVSTCSYKARAYGVRSGMPSYKALALCPELIVIKGDYHFYSLMSKEFFAYARKYTHIIEEASIDECYMDITSLAKKTDDVPGLLKKFQSGLLKKTGLKCSIGVAPTKFLAKMGSDMKKPMGITIIHKRDIKDKIYPLPITDFFGIGKKTAPRLKAMGIKTIGDLAEFIKDEGKAEEYFGSFYLDLKACLEGTSSDTVHTEYDDPKSIGNSMTLMRDTADEEEIARAIMLMAKEVSMRAKGQKVKGKTIQLVLKDPTFKVHNKSMTVSEAIVEANDIHAIANRLYLDNYRGETFRLVGVTLQNLVPLHEENIQMSLFNYEDYEKTDDVNNIIQNVNRKFKKKVVDKASLMLKEKGHGNR